MIFSFRSRETEAIWRGNFVKSLPPDINDRLRLCFLWSGRGAKEVEIVE